MNRVKILALFILVLFAAGAAESKGFVLSPSAFGTYGGYSNGRSSRELAAYVTLAKYQKQFVSVGYSDLQVSHAQWKYHQQMPIGGVRLSQAPIRLKAYYGHVKGSFDSRIYAGYGYVDRADLGSGELIADIRPFEFGMEYARFSGAGVQVQHADQITARLSYVHWVPPVPFTLTLRPNYVELLDGRKLYSVAAKAMMVPPQTNWFLSAGGSIGKRAYYFDNDLLVIFNQNDTQQAMVFGQFEAPLGRWLSVTAEYIYTRFQYVPVAGIADKNYSIQYAVAGIKTRFPI